MPFIDTLKHTQTHIYAIASQWLLHECKACKPYMHARADTHTHTHRLVKRQAEILQPNASTWEAKKNRHSERHTHSVVKKQAMKISTQPDVNTCEAKKYTRKDTQNRHTHDARAKTDARTHT